jgi:hypothetical protein
MWDIPWWVALIVAWAAGSAGFMFGLILAVGTQADRDLEELHENDVKKARKHANVPRGYNFGRCHLPDTRRQGSM